MSKGLDVTAFGRWDACGLPMHTCGLKDLLGLPKYSYSRQLCVVVSLVKVTVNPNS